LKCPGPIALGELEQMDPVELVGRDGIEQPRDGVAMGIDEREAAPGGKVVGGEGDEFGALARARPPDERDVAEEQALRNADGLPRGGGHLTHPDSAADGGPPHAQIVAREADSGQQILDQAKLPRFDSSPASGHLISCQAGRPNPHSRLRSRRAPDHVSAAQPRLA